MLSDQNTHMDENEDLETLGEQLYPLIYHKHQEHAAKLTGMLLELPGPVLSQMLQDEVLLSEALEKAVGALQVEEEPSEVEDGLSSSSDSLGDKLFDLVDVYNTGQSHKITGMLLEQQRDVLMELLVDSRLLEQQVEVAVKTLQQVEEETDASDSSDGEEAEQLGEQLFLLVEEVEPLHANDITGMLLEMNPDALRPLLLDRALLEGAVHKAQGALQGGALQGALQGAQQGGALQPPS